MGIPDHLSCLLRQEEVKKQQLEPNMEQQSGSNLGKECFRAGYCLPAYFIYVQRTARAMPHRRRMAHSERLYLLSQLWVGGWARFGLGSLLQLWVGGWARFGLGSLSALGWRLGSLWAGLTLSALGWRLGSLWVGLTLSALGWRF